MHELYITFACIKCLYRNELTCTLDMYVCIYSYTTLGLWESRDSNKKGKKPD